MRSSFLFLSETISEVRFLVSSIFFHVFISSCFNRAILLANSWASLSILSKIVQITTLLLSPALSLCQCSRLCIVKSLRCVILSLLLGTLVVHAVIDLLQIGVVLCVHFKYYFNYNQLIQCD